MAEPTVVQGPMTLGGMTLQTDPKDRFTDVDYPELMASSHEDFAPVYHKETMDPETGQPVYVYPKNAPKPRRFESNIANHRLTVRITKPTKDSGDRSVEGVNEYVQFRDGQLVTSIPSQIIAVERCRDYGTGIVDVERRQEVLEKRARVAIVERVRGDVELQQVLKAEFGMKDFAPSVSEEEVEGPKAEDYAGEPYKPQGPKAKGRGKGK
jgi:hypothetical protein